MSTTARITVPVTVVLTTRDSTPEAAYARGRAFLIERLVELQAVAVDGPLEALARAWRRRRWAVTARGD